MSTETQSKYISDLTVLKTKEFKEVKELITASQIVGDNAELVNNAQSIAEITAALTDKQASELIDALIATKEPSRANSYSPKRVDKTIEILDDIKATVNNWDFE